MDSPRASTRPWQHVLDCLAGYFHFAERLLTDPERAPNCLNFGPRAGDPMIPTGELAARIQTAMGLKTHWTLDQADAPAEKAHLSIDPGQAGRVLNWQPRFDAEAT